MGNKVIDIEELHQDSKNFNKGTADGQRLMEKSFSELGAGRSILLDKSGNIIAGNKSQLAAIAAGIKKVRVIETDGSELVAVKRVDVDIDSLKGRELALADNLTQQVNLSWDMDMVGDVAGDFGIDLDDWGLDVSSFSDAESEEDVIEMRRKEFEEKMKAGTLDEDDPEYQEFLKKFEAKRTTDDCYTPELVYEAVADWVAKEYGLSRSQFKRPFYPGGDYQKEKYLQGDVVVDNPPFSFLAEIIGFFHERDIPFFLFCPHLTAMKRSTCCTFIPVGVNVIYENQANVDTSFVTNLGDRTIRVMSSPSLYEAVHQAVQKDQKGKKRTLPCYQYEKHVVTSNIFHHFSRYGIDFMVPVSESVVIEALDCQKESGKAIYGGGLLVSDSIAEAKEKAERELSERKEAARKDIHIWALSEREESIVKGLGKDL